VTCRVCGAGPDEFPRMAPGLGDLCTVCAQAAAAVRDWYKNAANTEPENYSALLREAVHGHLVTGPRVQVDLAKGPLKRVGDV
jgi:hypothetical protein